MNSVGQKRGNLAFYDSAEKASRDAEVEARNGYEVYICKVLPIAIFKPSFITKWLTGETK